MPKRFSFIVLAIAVVAMCLLAMPAFGQFGEAKGSIHGKTVDQQGGVLPGVSVTVKGPAAPQTIFTDARGEFHSVNLPPGIYTLTLALQGFSTVNQENVTVNIGRATELTVTMALSAVAATVTVVAEAPVIDTRRVVLGATVTQEELRDNPTSRDPWVILSTIPSVYVDRVNVAGSEAGQQSIFSSKGSTGGSFTVDGVNLTDMSALGASAGYYDFDSFQEMQVITGGSDPSVQGTGAHLNMITKRGTNDLHGSARVFVVDNHFESTNVPAEATTQTVPLAAGNQIQSVQDYGVEAGGPAWKDHIWLWGSYGRDQINLITAGGSGVLDRTTLENFNAKLDYQVIPSNSLNVWYMRSDKLKFGRNAGPTHPQPTTWDQITPQNTWKLQDSEVFTSNLFASAQYSGQNGLFTLMPEGGLNRQTFVDANGVWANTYEFYSAPRPQRQVKADATYFFNTGSIGHELKAGFSYLKAGVTSTSIWPGSLDCAGCLAPFLGNGQAAQTYGDELDCGAPCAVITRNGTFSAQAKYFGYFLGDTITMDRLTVNAGLRYDKQYGSNLASSVPANASFPTIMPALNYLGAPGGFTYSDVTPRVGLTYALGTNRTTLLKGSYSIYAEALGTGTIAATNPVAGAAYAYYYWTDTNGDGAVQPGEVDTSAAGFVYSRNRNDACPGCVGTPPNGIDPNLKAPRTEEYIVGVDQELMPAFAVGVNYTHRKFKDVLYSPGHVFDPTTGAVATSADYMIERDMSDLFVCQVPVVPCPLASRTPLMLPDGTLLSGPLYTYAPGGVPTGAPSGSFTMNRPNFNTTYDGVEFVLTKRLTNKWMARGSFTWNNNKQHVGAGGCIDPSNQLSNSSTNGQTCRDGDVVAVRSTGSGNKGAVFLNSKWQFNMLGMYQLPLGFNLATNVFGRQGYPINYFINVTSPGDGLTRTIVVTPANNPRYDTVFEWDLRLEKVANITASSTLTLSVDLFNVTNQNTVLQRQNQTYRTCRASGDCSVRPVAPLGPGPQLASRNTIREIQSPRVFRFGARLAF